MYVTQIRAFLKSGSFAPLRQNLTCQNRYHRADPNVTGSQARSKMGVPKQEFESLIEGSELKKSNSVNRTRAQQTKHFVRLQRTIGKQNSQILFSELVSDHLGIIDIAERVANRATVNANSSSSSIIVQEIGGQ